MGCNFSWYHDVAEMFWPQHIRLRYVTSQGSLSMTLVLYSPSGKTSCRKISWSLEAARFGFKLFQSLWKLAGASAALLPRCLSNFRAIRPLQHPVSRLRDFAGFGGKKSYRLVKRGPGWDDVLHGEKNFLKICKTFDNISGYFFASLKSTWKIVSGHDNYASLMLKTGFLQNIWYCRMHNFYLKDVAFKMFQKANVDEYNYDRYQDGIVYS